MPDPLPPEILAPRAVHRALADLRRGTPVRLAGPELIVLPAETAGAEGLRELNAARIGPPILLLAASRALGLGLSVPGDPASGHLISLALAPDLLSSPLLRGLADPTAEQMLTTLPHPMPAPAGSKAAVQLAKLARLLPAVLVAPGAAQPAAAQELLTVPETAVLEYATNAATGLVLVSETAIPLAGARDARVMAFRAPDAGIEHLAIVVGRPDARDAPLVRIHSECFTGDLLGSLRCDCGQQLQEAIHRMGEEGAGVLLYLAQEGRGIGLVNKLRAYTLQDQAGQLDTLDANRALGWEADERNFLLAATMLRALHVPRIRLLTNNPDKVAALQAYGIDVAAREPHQIPPNGVNDRYLATKAKRFGHLLG